jgi:hypothetical protein
MHLKRLLFVQFSSFDFVLVYTTDGSDSEIIQNIGLESELNHSIYYVMGLRDTEFRLQVRE